MRRHPRPLRILWPRVVALGGVVLAVTLAAAAALGVTGPGLGGPQRIADCVAPAHAYGGDPDLDDMASEGLVQDGATREEALQWLERVSRVDYLQDALRGSNVRNDFMGLELDDSRRQVVVGVRNHENDDAIRDCARRLTLPPLRLKVVKNSEWELSKGQARFEKSVQDVPGELFETYQEHVGYYVVEIYREATPAQRARLKRAARASGVEVKVKETNTSQPKETLV